MRTRAEVLHAFTPNYKLSVAQKQILNNITKEFQDLATSIIDQVPESADRTSAFRKLLDAKQAAIQAITHAPAPEDKVSKLTKPVTTEAVNVESQT